MNKSNVQHAAYAIAMQLVILLATNSLLHGAFFATAWFISREHTQREYAIHVFGQKYNLKWWQGFTGWSKDDWLDALAPAAAVWFIAGVGLAVR